MNTTPNREKNHGAPESLAKYIHTMPNMIAMRADSIL